MKFYNPFFVFLALFSIQASSQMYQISGRVKDYATLDDLPFVTIINKSTKHGAQTNKQGFFSLKAQIKDTLEFSFLGYETTVLIIKDIKNDIQVVMKKYTIENYFLLVGKCVVLYYTYFFGILGVRILEFIHYHVAQAQHIKEWGLMEIGNR